MLIVSRRVALNFTEINDECFILEERLKELKERRERVEGEIKVYYHTMLSPARANILCDIFSHCLPVHRNSAMSALDSPVLLIHIFISWRSIVLHSSRLWARWHIPLAAAGRGRDSAIEFPTYPFQREASDIQRENVSCIMRIRCEVI